MLQEIKELLDLRVFLAHRELLEPQVLREPRDPPDLLDHQDLLENK